ncbi:MAG: hypothetical protein BWY65_02178 [Firmicutes bacterium ADurb.Bin373]|nr:MAG: hypothetical protein BWY65_02178 [Firmicutes bacterium ADurb.Bin373]
MRSNEKYKHTSQKAWPFLLLISLVWLAFFLLRLGGPPDLRAFDQERPASYVMDVVQNGHWACQRDFQNNISSKPPLYTWLAALTTISLGRISRFSIYFPTALAALITACIIFFAGYRLFGQVDGCMAALFYIVSAPGLKQLCLARTDPLFTMLVALAGVFAYRAWALQKSWTWFWLASAAITLTKGPLGIIIAAGGLSAFFWERKEGNRLPFGGVQLPGIILFLSITLTWFFMAYAACGKPFIDTMISRELVGHAVGGYKDKIPLLGFYKPAFYFLTRFFPWSILSVMGFWRIWRRPAQDPNRRAAERFLFCYFFFGLAVLSLASHHRGDLMFPLVPAASLAAGNMAARRFHFSTARSFLLPAAACAGIALAATGAYYYLFRTDDAYVLATCRLKHDAAQIASLLGRGTRVEYVGTDYTLQFYLNLLQPWITCGEAVRLMAMPDPIIIVARSASQDTIRSYLADMPVYVLFQSKDIVAISNRPPAPI